MKNFKKSLIIVMVLVAALLCGTLVVASAESLAVTNHATPFKGWYELQTQDAGEQEVIGLFATISGYDKDIVTEYGFIVKRPGETCTTEGVYVPATSISNDGKFGVVLYGFDKVADYTATAYYKTETETVPAEGELTFTIDDMFNVPATFEVAAYNDECLLGETFTIPSVTVKFGDEEVTDPTIVVTAKFNDDTVDVTSGTYTATEEGDLEITYSFEDFTETITVAFSRCVDVSFASQQLVEGAPYPYGIPNDGKNVRFKGTDNYKVNLTIDGLTTDELKAKYDYLTFTLRFDHWGAAFDVYYNGTLGMNSKYQTIYSMVIAGADHQTYTVTIPTEVWNGYLLLCPSNCEKGNGPENTWGTYGSEGLEGYFYLRIENIAAGIKDEVSATMTSAQFTTVVKRWNPYAGTHENQGVQFNNVAGVTLDITFNGLTTAELKEQYDYISLYLINENCGAQMEYKWKKSDGSFTSDYVRVPDQQETTIVIRTADWDGQLRVVWGGSVSEGHGSWGSEYNGDGDNRVLFLSAKIGRDLE